MTYLQEEIARVLKGNFNEFELDEMYDATPNEDKYWLQILNATGKITETDF